MAQSKKATTQSISQPPGLLIPTTSSDEREQTFQGVLNIGGPHPKLHHLRCADPDPGAGDTFTYPERRKIHNYPKIRAK